MLEELALDEPWITLPGSPLEGPPPIVVAHTDEHFELKLGVTMLVLEHYFRTNPDHLGFAILATPGSRWDRETWAMQSLRLGYWEAYAEAIMPARVVLSDCSAAHVLAVAMGVPTVLLEPNPMRHNPVFYPLGDRGPQVTLVRGVDGQPTFDARHVADALDVALAMSEETTDGRRDTHDQAG